MATSTAHHPDPVAEALLGEVGSLDGGLIDETLGTMPPIHGPRSTVHRRDWYVARLLASDPKVGMMPFSR